MVLDKLFTFQAIESSQRKETGRTPDMYQMKSGSESASAENRFQDILRGISEKQKSSREEKPVTLKDINEKLENLENKIESMEKNPQGLDETQKKNIEELKSVIEKIKELLKNQKEGAQNVRLEFGKVSIDFTAFISELLTKISEMMGNPNQKDFSSLLKFLNKKLDETKSILAANSPKTSDGKEVKTETKLNQNEKTEDPAQAGREKVKVIDKRTQPAETNDTGKSSKTLKGGSLVGEVAADMQQKASDKKTVKSFSDTLYQKITDKDSFDSSRMREAAVQFQNRMEQNQNVSAKQYASFSSAVSKANMEAIMQNVAGRVLVTLRDGKSEMKMNLVPPELGRMHMKFTLEDGRMIGRIVVSTPEAKALFDQNLGDLQRALQQAGVTLAQLDVSLGQDGNMSGQDESGNASARVGGIDSLEAGQFENDEPVKNMWESTINYIA
jgi:flagellar hook-length control protein FliK